MNNWLCLAIAIVSETVATTALKASDGFSKPLPSALVVAGYGLAFYFLSLTLRTIPLGISYAVWSGVGIVLVTLAGWVLYGQKLDGGALAGIGLILAGVLVMNLFSKTAGHFPGVLRLADPPPRRAAAPGTGGHCAGHTATLSRVTVARLSH
jgi:small multidrug resistance pump